MNESFWWLKSIYVFVPEIRECMFGHPQWIRSWSQGSEHSWRQDIQTKPVNLVSDSMTCITINILLSSFADVTMQDQMVIYDNERGQIGWIRAPCDRIPKFGSSALLWSFHTPFTANINTLNLILFIQTATIPFMDLRKVIVGLISLGSLVFRTKIARPITTQIKHDYQEKATAH